MRTYLVVIDETEEARLAQRFAARRAARTGGNVHLLMVIAPQAFVAWGGVQATIEEEARQHGEAVAQAAAAAMREDYGLDPAISIRHGEATQVVRDLLSENHDIAALVLAAAASGAPGPLVTEFTGTDAGTLSVPVMLVPGSLSDEELDRLS